MKLPDSRYTVTAVWNGHTTRQYAARFCNRLVGTYKYENDAATALWDYHGDRMHDMRTACPVPLGMTA